MKYTIATPHLVDGTYDVLKNKLGFTNKKDLARFETLSFAIRRETSPNGDFSIDHFQKIHKHLFQDLYEWAGEFRNVPTSKGSSRFCQPQYIKQELQKTISSLDLKKMENRAFLNKLAETISDINAIHPFLDGNGRTIRVYAEKICETTDREFKIENLEENIWNEVSKKSFLGDNAPLVKLLSENIVNIKK